MTALYICLYKQSQTECNKISKPRTTTATATQRCKIGKEEEETEDAEVKNQSSEE